jgi:hypothetical protein
MVSCSSRMQNFSALYVGRLRSAESDVTNSNKNNRRGHFRCDGLNDIKSHFGVVLQAKNN